MTPTFSSIARRKVARLLLGVALAGSVAVATNSTPAAQASGYPSISASGYTGWPGGVSVNGQGFSDGGSGALVMGLYYPTPWAGLLALSASVMVAAIAPDPTQLGDARDIYQRSRRREAQFHHRNQAVAACQRSRRLAEIRQERDSVANGRRPVIGE